MKCERCRYETLSLAELADMRDRYIITYTDDIHWKIQVKTEKPGFIGDSELIKAKTYAEAESKARLYLEGLSDADKEDK